MSVFKYWRTGAFLSARVVTDCLVSIRRLSWVPLLGVAQRSHVVLKTILGGFPWHHILASIREGRLKWVSIK